MASENENIESENENLDSESENENIESENENLDSENENIESENENLDSENENLDSENENIESENENENMESENENLDSENENDSLHSNVRRRKPGIIFLSTIPPHMNVTTIRAYFSKFAQLDRVFLQPLSNSKQRKKKFSEGWIEFKSKRKAKYVQSCLNNQAVGGKKSNPDHDVLWNIKYLPRFKWEFLTQRLEYERQTFKKRMSAEISQVNKETDYYLKVTMQKHRKSKHFNERNGRNIDQIFKQKQTEEEIVKKKLTKKEKDAKFKKSFEKKKRRKQELKHKKQENDDLATSIFVGN